MENKPQPQANQDQSAQFRKRERIKSAIRTVPPSDVNFKSALDDADAEMIREALENIPEENNKSRIRILTAKLNSLDKSRPKALREDLQNRKDALEAKGWEIDVENKSAYRKFGQFESVDISNEVSIEHLFSQAEAQELSYSDNSDDYDGDEKTVSNAETVRSIPIGKIIPSPFEPQARRRAKFKKEEIESLGSSIWKNGLRQPILVRPIGEQFEIVFGERRFLAFQKTGFPNINCFVEDLSDAQTIELQYEENHNRQEPDPLDDAFTFHYLQTEKGYTIEDLAVKFAMDKSSVRRRLKLHDLIPEAKELLSNGTLPLGHAVFMAALPEAAQKEIIDENMLTDGWENDPVIPLADFKIEIGREIVRDLSSAPFDTRDPRLHLKGLICANCTQRTGFEPKLFDEELAKGDKCLNKSCFELKSNVHLKLKREEIAEKIPLPVVTDDSAGDDDGDGAEKVLEKKIASVPLVTERSSVDRSEIPVKGTVLTNQKLMGEPECEFSQIGLAVAGAKRGQQVWICQNDKCPTHHPETIAPQDNQPSEQELRGEQFRFDAKVRFALREKVFSEAVKTFTDTNVFWQFDDLVQELLNRLWFRSGYDVQDFMLKICKDWKNLPKNKTDKEQVAQFIESLDKEKQSRLLFLFTFYSIGMYSNSDPAELEEFAYRFTKLEYCLIEQEIRHELAPDEFKALAAFNVERARNGLYMDIENFWWNEPKQIE